ncbi:hypothetical protein [Desulfurococcus amylolyticus]|uniref:hypothetical protein n=1 Tax=Desulfurococcus amylolyticus TaxID=94694 RepID=UPI00064F8771|nr:hypothetical protein [Desulfurococcus amylolyticus]
MYLDVMGLVMLGVFEAVKPGLAREVLQKVKEAVRRRVRDFVIAEPLYNVWREQFCWAWEKEGKRSKM